MCGRTACTLNPEQLCAKCAYKNGKSIVVEPEWISSKTEKGVYSPKYNFAPTNFGPVLVSGSDLSKCEDEHQRKIVSMRWGLIPSWVKEGHTKYNMINAKAESIMAKPAFKSALQKGRRCAVIADGFYEWAVNDKQPYYLRMNCEQPDYTPLLFMAGVFDIAHDNKGDELYSYSIITVDSHEKLNWIHHRMPAILTNEEEIRGWIEKDEMSIDDALQILQPKDCLQFYPVNPSVGKTTFEGPQCIELYNKPKSSNKQTSLKSFFKPNIKINEDLGEPKPKIQKNS